MPGSHDPSGKGSLDALAQRIRVGIEQKGVHLVFEDELSITWNSQPGKTVHEKSIAIKNFAITYGLEAHVSASAKMALFRITKQAPPL